MGKIAKNKLTPFLFLEEIRKVSGLLVERELGVYEFAHLSFQEYLAATQIKKIQQENILINNFDNSWWTETIRLYAAQGDATNLIRKAIENKTVNSLTLALDCIEEGSKVEPRVRAELEEMLEEGLKSSDSEIARLAAEVKLSRRLNNLRKIDENTEIDLSYITHAEYQLFVDEQLNSQWHFLSGDAKKPIKISRENACKFCNWLSSKKSFMKPGSDDVYYFRLPTVNEAQENLVTGHRQRIFWDFGGNSQPQNRVQLVRVKIQQYGIERTSNTTLFDVVTVNRQAEIIQWQRCQAEYSSEDLGNNITLDMVAIPSGTFTMAAPKDEKDSRDSELPQHQVTVQSFLMGKYPVTQAQWKAVALLPKVNRYLKPEPFYFKGDNLPVEQVSWYDAVEFCDRLSKYTGRKYRLPSEAEWEYACRAGTTTPFHFGETITGELANYRTSETYVDEPKGKYRKTTTPV